MLTAAAAPRALSTQRLLSIHRSTESWRHLPFDDLPGLLAPGDAPGPDEQR